MLIEIHIIQNHSASNLNRDDTGSPKECVFGGVKRGRISSQCLKRSIRRSDLFQTAMEGQLAARTRRLPELVRDALKEELGKEMAEIAAQKASGFGTREGKERPAEKGEYNTAQTMFLTNGDIEAVADTLREAAREAGTPAAFKKLAAKDLQDTAGKKGFRPVSVDVALFGRMITSGVFRDVEASCQVAHAVSTHKVEHEYDYFTAVDDLRDSLAEDEEDAGADMIGDIEFNASCYYKYASIDLDGLTKNLTGENLGRRVVSDADKVEAAGAAMRAISAFLKAACLTTPTGKQNTFAAHQLPAAVLVEVRPHKTPVSYANAFVDPARLWDDGAKRPTDLVTASLNKLSSHVESLTSGFNLESSPRLLLAPEHTEMMIAGVERVPDLATLCDRIEEVCRG